MAWRLRRHKRSGWGHKCVVDEWVPQGAALKKLSVLGKLNYIYLRQNTTAHEYTRGVFVSPTPTAFRPEFRLGLHLCSHPLRHPATATSSARASVGCRAGHHLSPFHVDLPFPAPPAKPDLEQGRPVAGKDRQSDRDGYSLLPDRYSNGAVPAINGKRSLAAELGRKTGYVLD